MNRWIMGVLYSMRGAVAAERRQGNRRKGHRLEGIIDRAQRCMGRCSRSVPASAKGFDDFSSVLSPLSLSGSWSPLSGEGRMLSMRLMAKQGELMRVSRRIGAIHDALIGQSRLDPEVRRIQAAAQRLEQADARAHELERRIDAETALNQ
jgi:hypothetical protein